MNDNNSDLPNRDYELQRQIAKDLLKEKMQRELKLIKLNKRLQERLLPHSASSDSHVLLGS